MTEYANFQTIISLAAMTEAFEDDVRGALRKESHRCVARVFRVHYSLVMSRDQYADARDFREIFGAGTGAVEVDLCAGR